MTYELLEAGLIPGQSIAKMWAKVRSGGWVVRVTLFERYNFNKQQIDTWVGLPRREMQEPTFMPDGTMRKTFQKEVETNGKDNDRELLKATYHRVQVAAATQEQESRPGWRDMRKTGKTEPEVHDTAGGFFAGYDKTGGIVRMRRTTKRVEGDVFHNLGTKDYVPDTAPPGEKLMHETDQRADGAVWDL